MNKKPEEHIHAMTVGQLLDFIEKNNIPRDSKVLYQRIEDVYFNLRSWDTVDRKGEGYHAAIREKEKAKGEWLNKEEYPNMTQEIIDSTLALDPDEFKDEYIVAWSPVKYEEDNHLYITAHY